MKILFCLLKSRNESVEPMLVMEKIFYVRRFCSSNLTLLRPNKLFVTSSKPGVQEDCIK